MNLAEIHKDMEVLGADGVHIGAVASMEGHRIKLSQPDGTSAASEGAERFISIGLVAEVRDQKVRLSANADVALLLVEE